MAGIGWRQQYDEKMQEAKRLQCEVDRLFVGWYIACGVAAPVFICAVALCFHG